MVEFLSLAGNVAHGVVFGGAGSSWLSPPKPRTP
jgi:hypothetical protein